MKFLFWTFAHARAVDQQRDMDLERWSICLLASLGKRVLIQVLDPSHRALIALPKSEHLCQCRHALTNLKHSILSSYAGSSAEHVAEMLKSLILIHDPSIGPEAVPLSLPCQRACKRAALRRRCSIV